MSQNFHTPIVLGAPGTPATVNTPLSALDTALTATNTFAAGLVLAGGNVATLANGTAAAGQKEVVVDSSTGFIASARVAYLRVGGVVEYNIIGDIHSSTQLTMTTNVGTGGIGDNTYISMISESQYQLQQTVGPVALLNFATSLIPDINNTRDLGSAAKSWLNIYGYNVSATGALTVGGQVTANGSGIKVHPTNNVNNATSFALDSSAVAAWTIINNGVHTPFGAANNFSSGLLLVAETTGGATALILIGSGMLVIVSQTGTIFSTAVSTAGKINVYFDGSYILRVQNLSGTDRDFRWTAIRNRANV